MKNSFELMQSLFVNVGKSTGATIISAAAGNQFALERGDLKNGVFTYSLLEAMDKNKTIKISQLKKIVGERVEQLTNSMLMLIDACHSGEVDKADGIAMNKMADSLGLTKGIIIDDSVATKQQLFGLKNSFELMQSLFVNVGKSTGATIISAAAGNQFALERGDLKNGVFTYSLLEAMDKNKTIKISQLKKIVGERVEQLTNSMQKPTSRNETIEVDWSL